MLENCRSQMRYGIKMSEVFHLNELYEDYIREKVHEQLIEMAKRMLENGVLSLEKIAEYSGLELAEIRKLINEKHTVALKLIVIDT